MAALTLQSIIPAGLTVSLSAVNSSDTVTIGTGQRVFLHVKNENAGAVTVTITAVKTSAVVSGVGAVTVNDLTITVGPSSENLIGPFTEAYMTTDGLVTIGYDITSSITAAAVSLPAVY